MAHKNPDMGYGNAKGTKDSRGGKRRSSRRRHPPISQQQPDSRQGAGRTVSMSSTGSSHWQSANETLPEQS